MKFKRLWSVMLAIVLAVSALPLSALPASAEPAELWTDGLTADAAAAFSGGAGTQDAPYLISSPEDLAQLSVNVNEKANIYSGKYFRLTRDLDLAGRLWLPIAYHQGSAFDGDAFMGHFDGAFHVIRNMRIQSSACAGRVFFLGLFGWIYHGSIKNTGLENAGMEIDKPVEQQCGLLVGYADNGVSVENCFVKGNITAAADVSYIGGLVGQNYSGGTVKNCFYIGRIQAQNTTLADGILALYRGGAPVNCYAAVQIETTGGKIYGVAPSTAKNCFYDGDLLTPTQAVSGVTPKTAAEMRTPEFKDLLNGETGTAWAQSPLVNGGRPYPDGFRLANGIQGWDAEHGYDTVWFGSFGEAPVQWRVLDDRTNTGTPGLFLLSERALGEAGSTYGNVYFDTPTSSRSNVYQGSDAQKWCSDFALNGLTERELSAVLAVTGSDGEFVSSTKQLSFSAAPDILNGDRVFFLSAQEAENPAYGFTGDAARIAYFGSRRAYWWLRSPYSGNKLDPGFVNPDGVIDYYVHGDYSCAARPALNLDTACALFFSAGVGGKLSGEVGADALTAVPVPAGRDWKLTLRDSGRAFAVTETEAAAFTGGTVTLHYTGAAVGENEYVSAVIANGFGEPLYYGRLARPAESSGSAQLRLPAGLAEGAYTLKLFSEQYNGDRKTDYASDFVNIPLSVDAIRYTVRFDANGGEGAPAAQIKTHGEDLTLSAEVPTRENYKFLGWAATPDADCTQYGPGGACTQDGDLTLYAIWYLPGDVNFDGVVDAGDAVLVLRYDAKLIEFSEKQLAAGDVNFDGVVDAGDAVLILRYDARLIAGF